MAGTEFSELALSGFSDQAFAEMLDRAKAGDADAWRTLVQSYGPVIYRWVRCTGIQPSDAADVVQEVCQSIAQKLEGFRGDHASRSFRAWLWTITRNKICDYQRQQQAKPDGQCHSRLHHIPQPIVDPEQEFQNARCELIHGLLNTVKSEFESKTWDAFWRITANAEKPADVAVDLGMSVDAVYMAKSRVLKRIRAELGWLFSG